MLMFLRMPLVGSRWKQISTGTLVLFMSPWILSWMKFQTLYTAVYHFWHVFLPSLPWTDLLCFVHLTWNVSCLSLFFFLSFLFLLLLILWLSPAAIVSCEYIESNVFESDYSYRKYLVLNPQMQTARLIICKHLESVRSGFYMCIIIKPFPRLTNGHSSDERWRQLSHSTCHGFGNWWNHIKVSSHINF